MRSNARVLTATLAAVMLGTSSDSMAVIFTVLGTPAGTTDMPDLVPGDGICDAGPPYGCTLRAAIQETNKLPGVDSIIVEAGTYKLTRMGAGEDFADKGDLDIRDDVGILGEGPFTIIDGQLADRIFDIHAVGPVPLVVGIGEMTIRRGYSGREDGGAIRNAAHLVTLRMSVMESISELRGGGIAGVGAATFKMTDTAIIRNRAGSPDCGVPGRGGGGLYIASKATLNPVVIDSTIASNVSCTHGGGILAEGIRLSNVSVADNTASTSFGQGGGIYANVVELDRVTLEMNRSWSGAGLSIRGEARILNSTISNNTALTGGAGINSFGALYLSHVTMADNLTDDPVNPSGGLVHHGGLNGLPLPVIVNSILSDNRQTNCRVLDVQGAIVTLIGSHSARNLDTDDSCGFSTVGPNASIVLVPANIAPLAFNYISQGRTHLLLAGSPARDSASIRLCLKRDQRQQSRPIGEGCDMGSTEQ